MKGSDFKKLTNNLLIELQGLQNRFFKENADNINEIARLIWQSLRRGNKLLLFGNGGSAADAQHIAGELVNRLTSERMELPAIALTTNSSVITSIANDFDYSQIFSVQIRALGRKGDIALGLSTSGNSSNVIEGMKSAKELGLTTIALLGGDGGEVKKVVDYHLLVPHKSAPRVQEIHIIVGHLICQLIEEQLKTEGKSKT